jgi:hypothetical protein
MLTFEDFDSFFSKILREWPRGYGEEKIDLIWKHTRDCSVPQLKLIVTRCLEEHQRPPIVSWWRDAARVVKTASRGDYDVIKRNTIRESKLPKEYIKFNFELLENITSGNRKWSKREHGEYIKYHEEMIRISGGDNESYTCRNCNDTGKRIVDNQNSQLAVYRCDCVSGDKWDPRDSRSDGSDALKVQRYRG